MINTLVEKTEQYKPVDFGSIDLDTFVERRKIPRYRDLVKTNLDNFNDNYLNLLKSLEDNKNFKVVKEGQVVTGKIVKIDKKQIIVDINYKDYVYVDINSSDTPYISELQKTDEISVIITEIKNTPYIIKGSVSDLMKMKVTDLMKEHFLNKKPFKALVKEIIPAGFMLDMYVEGSVIPAFMPNTLADVNKLYNPTILLDEVIDVLLESLQQDKGIYVVNRKAYLLTLLYNNVEKIKKNPKDYKYEGFVTGTTPFGIFVQFNDCLTGMIHKYNIHEQNQHLIAGIEPGTRIQFYIKDILKGGKHIILTQILKDSLWDTIEIDNKFTGKIVALKQDSKPYGALVELDHETIGLIQNTFIVKNNKNLKIGDNIDVRVISLYKEDRKIYLTFADDNTYDIDRQENIKKLKDKFNQ